MEIYTSRMTYSGIEVGDDARLTVYSGNSMRPDIADSGSGVGVVWDDSRSSDYEIYFNMVEFCQ